MPIINQPALMWLAVMQNLHEKVTDLAFAQYGVSPLDVPTENLQGLAAQAGVQFSPEWMQRLDEQQAFEINAGLNTAASLAIPNAPTNTMDVYNQQYPTGMNTQPVVGTQSPTTTSGGGQQMIVQDGRTMTQGEYLAKLTEQVNELTRIVSQQGYNMGLKPQAARPNLLIAEKDITHNLLVEKAQAWWKAHNSPADMLGEKLQPGRKAALLQQYLNSPEVVNEISAKSGKTPIEISMATKMMMAAGASALVMMLTGGNFPLAAAAYFGVQAAIPTGGYKDGAQLFAGVANPEGATLDGYEIKPMDVQIPDGLPNQVFAEYRFICYDRLSGRWYPSDEIRPLEYDSNEEFRWFCLDRVSGRTYKANLIKKPRVYLQ